jgi:TrmH family RNA methyltransferase
VFGEHVCAATSAEVRDWLKSAGVPSFAAKPQAEISYVEADYRGGAAFVLGSEAEGLSDGWSGAEITAIALPMRGVCDSLNVSATAAVLFYEAQRQRAARR